MPDEKQHIIINSALSVFSKYDYKKASTEEIAKVAGVSKALLFHYFENKKGLYIFLYDYGINFISSNMTKEFDFNETDFFKLFINAQKIKCEMMKKHPYVFHFLLKAYYEKSTEICKDIQSKNQFIGDRSMSLFLSNVDKSKFKDSIDMQMLMNIITWCSEGYMKDRAIESPEDIDRIDEEFQGVLEIFRRNFYKEEYL